MKGERGVRSEGQSHLSLANTSVQKMIKMTPVTPCSSTPLKASMDVMQQMIDWRRYIREREREETKDALRGQSYYKQLGRW